MKTWLYFFLWTITLATLVISPVVLTITFNNPWFVSIWILSFPTVVTLLTKDPFYNLIKE